MKIALRHLRHALSGLLLSGFLAGCSASGYQRVQPTPIDQASEQIPENELLDVGVALSVAPELSERELERQGTHPDIRRSERVYIPYHLKNTLQLSSYWGVVQVIPPNDETVDLKITSELVESNGEEMRFKVEAVDATGRVWFTEKYQAIVTEDAYYNTATGQHEAFQDLYNTIANELSAFKRSLTPADVEHIRAVSRLRFAEEFVPDAYDDYLIEEAEGRWVVERLPADDDPLMERVEMIREREQMFLDSLNQYYEGFYVHMWEAYENWRKFNLAEQVAMRRIEHEAFMRTLTGVLMIAAAVALEAGDVGNTTSISNVLVLTGGQVVISGVNVSQQANIHAEAIKELSESFGAEIHPTVIQLEGKQYELTGTAAEQYRSWKDLLRRIYFEETGFGPANEQVDAGGPAPDATTIDP